MDNRFSSFNKAKQELQEINYKVKRPKIVEIEEKRKHIHLHFYLQRGGC